MRVVIASILFLSSSVFAFSPTIQSRTSKTQLKSQRRDFIISGIVGLLIAPEIATAKAASTFFYDEKIEFVKEESQMPTGGKVDLNSAFVGEYKVFQGMFPHAAGKIASHGPYASVKDIYKIEGLTENDKKLFKKYEKEFTTNPPGRSFNERVNSRFST